jgi:hypothetical protein
MSKYKYAILIEAAADGDLQMLQSECCSKFYSVDHTDFIGVVFTEDKDAAQTELSKKEVVYKVVPFSTLPRLLKAQGMLKLHTHADRDLRVQLDGYIESSELVKAVLEHLGIKAINLAKMLSCRPTDINLWLSMLAKPDTFKVDTLQYLLTLDRDNAYVKHLLSKCHERVTVSVINEATGAKMKTLTKVFKSKSDAEAYRSKLEKELFGSGLNVSIV